MTSRRDAETQREGEVRGVVCRAASGLPWLFTEIAIGIGIEIVSTVAIDHMLFTRRVTSAAKRLSRVTTRRSR